MSAIRLAFAPLLLLGACERSDGNITARIDLSDANNGSAVAITSNSADGKVSIKVPGLEAKVNLPRIALDNSSFDIDGVDLFPGSKVTAVDIRGRGDTDGTVNVSFTAPAEPAAVKDYFLTAFARRGITATATPSGLAGEDKSGAPFVVTLTPAGAATTGMIRLREGS